MRKSTGFILAAMPISFVGLAFAFFNWPAGSRWAQYQTRTDAALLAYVLPMEMRRTLKTRASVIAATEPYFFELEGRHCLLLVWTQTQEKTITCIDSSSGRVVDHDVS